MKKIMSILLSIAMVFASFTAVCAEGEKVMVAKVNSTQYSTLASAIDAANGSSGGDITITLLANCNEEIDKTINNSITIDGDNFAMTGKLKLTGKNTNNITVENFNISNYGIDIQNFNEVTVTNNTINNITNPNSANGTWGYEDGILVQSSNVATITNNNIDTTKEVGIDCRDISNTVTITNNTIKNTDHNSVQVVWINDDNQIKPSATITGNRFENWAKGTSNEGRALRARTSSLTFTENVMINSSSKEQFVKLEGSTGTADVSKNYWNGYDPLGKIGTSETDVYSGIGDKHEEIVSYYSDSDKKILVDYYVAAIDNTKYLTLVDAFANANGKTITLLNDVVLNKRINVDPGKDITLDLNGKTISTVSEPVFSNPTSGLLLVRNGGSLTINDSVGTGKITTYGTTVYAAVALTLKGDTDFKKPATLIINGGTLEGDLYAIVGNGNRPNTEIVINGGYIKGIKADDSAGIYHPQKGTLTINGGTIEGATGLYVKSGSVITSINGGTIKSVGNHKDYKTTGDGFECVGDGLILDNCEYPGGEPKAIIRGGYFYNTKDSTKSISSYAKTGKTPISKFIRGGYYVTKPEDSYICDGFVAKNVDTTSKEYTDGYRYYVCASKEDAHTVKEENIGGVNAVSESYVLGSMIETVSGLDNAIDTSSLINKIVQSVSGTEKVDIEVVLKEEAVDYSTNDDAKAIYDNRDDAKGQEFESYLDLTINSTVLVNGEKNDTYSKPIYETATYQYITVKVSDTLKNKLNKIIVTRKHGNEIKTLTKAASEYDAKKCSGSCYYITGNETDGYTIVIKTDKFSVYAIGSQNVPVAEYKYVEPVAPTPSKKTNRYVAPKTGVE